VRRLAHRIRDDDRGAGYLAAFIVLFPMLLGAGVGILVDSARIFAADRQCTSIAFEAARAGANALHAEAIRDGAIEIDTGAASAAASAAAAALVSSAGATLQSVTVDGDAVTVVVSADVDAWFPLISDRTVTERATARAGMVDR
jgi:Flp pilus assembly protein TadG